MKTAITTHPVNSTTVVALKDVVLSCSASVDDVAYSWHRVSCDLPLQSQGENSSTFTILGATPHDVGTYYCTARKNGVSVKSNNALVQVDGKGLCNVQYLK